MNLFLDTNIYLGFYHYTNDDLEELDKLLVLLKEKEYNLFVTDQLIDEFYRNRENKIKNAIDALKDQKLDFRFPQLCKDYREFEALNNFQRQYSKIHAELILSILSDVNSEKLKADVMIKKLFDSAIHHATTQDILNEAQIRCNKGNPPGKQGSLGDAINWEILLSAVKNTEELFLISDDNDYSSPLDKNRFNNFLLNEWRQKKTSEIFYFKSLSVFFQKHYPKIKISRDLEIQLLIQKLATSPNFATTHSIIANLNRFTDFSIDQINSIVQASLSNEQVYWIINDEDVNNFIVSLISGNENNINGSAMSTLSDLLGAYDENNIDEIPF